MMGSARTWALGALFRVARAAVTQNHPGGLCSGLSISASCETPGLLSAGPWPSSTSAWAPEEASLSLPSAIPHPISGLVAVYRVSSGDFLAMSDRRVVESPSVPGGDFLTTRGASSAQRGVDAALFGETRSPVPRSHANMVFTCSSSSSRMALPQANGGEGAGQEVGKEGRAPSGDGRAPQGIGGRTQQPGRLGLVVTPLRGFDRPTDIPRDKNSAAVDDKVPTLQYRR